MVPATLSAPALNNQENVQSPNNTKVYKTCPKLWLMQTSLSHVSTLSQNCRVNMVPKNTEKTHQHPQNLDTHNPYPLQQLLISALFLLSKQNQSLQNLVHI